MEIIIAFYINCPFSKNFVNFLARVNFWQINFRQFYYQNEGQKDLNQ